VDRAEPLLRGGLERARWQFGPNDPRTARVMAQLGMLLVKQDKYTEAEALLRECLTVREAKLPDDWTTFDTRSMLGGSLLAQKKFMEAELLLVSGYDGIKSREAKIPAASKLRLTEAGARIVQLYDAWEKPERAAEWRTRLGLAPELPADPFAR
jgi:hypothetical protein